MTRPLHKAPAKVALDFCARLAAGQSIETICSQRDQPEWERVRLWLVRDPDFRRLYDQALADQGELVASRLAEIAAGLRPGSAESVRLLLALLTQRRGRPETQAATEAVAATGEAEVALDDLLRAALAAPGGENDGEAGDGA